MSQQELVGAYLDGQISRRTLVRRLVAAGVSLGAAASYAQLLAPRRAAAAPMPGHYPNLDVNIRSDSLATVVAEERLVVKVTADEDLTVALNAYRIDREGAIQKFLGSKTVSITGPDTIRVRIPLTRSAVNHLAGRTKARVLVTAAACDAEFFCPSASDTKKLT